MIDKNMYFLIVNKMNFKELVMSEIRSNSSHDEPILYWQQLIEKKHAFVFN